MFLVRLTLVDDVFTVLPAWYQTASFTTLAVCFGVVAVWMLYRLRVQQLAGQFNGGLDARVSERTRIARELHDTMLQSVQALAIHIQIAANLLPVRPDEAKERLEDAIGQASRAIAEGRHVVQDLRASTVAESDLAAAIRVLGDELVAAHAANPGVVRVNVVGTPRTLRPILRDHVYRIAAEAVRNALRHAGACLIQVDLTYEDRQLWLRVRDDGHGIDSKALGERVTGHFGLSGMRERAALIGGQWHIRSQVGSGTQIDLIVPAVAAYATSSTGRRFRLFYRTTDGQTA